MKKSIQILAATSSAKHEAPWVVGHPKHDDPTDGLAESKQLDNGWDRISSHRLT